AVEQNDDEDGGEGGVELGFVLDELRVDDADEDEGDDGGGDAFHLRDDDGVGEESHLREDTANRASAQLIGAEPGTMVMVGAAGLRMSFVLKRSRGGVLYGAGSAGSRISLAVFSLAAAARREVSGRQSRTNAATYGTAATAVKRTIAIAATARGRALRS